ncbi:MAG TPA: sigma-70 family RNA polymerase sigma factor [Bacteroidia bacterium]
MSATQSIVNEQELVSKLKFGDKQAFARLYDSYSSALLGVIMRTIDNEDIANDILQDVFVKIWKNIQSYQPERGRLYTWMLNIARNSAIDYSRSAQNKNEQLNQSMEDSVYHVDSSFSVKQETDVIGLKKIVEKLSEDHQIILDFVYFKGYTQDEASKALNLPLGTVKSRVRAAINELRKILGRELT